MDRALRLMLTNYVPTATVLHEGKWLPAANNLKHLLQQIINELVGH